MVGRLFGLAHGIDAEERRGPVRGPVVDNMHFVDLAPGGCVACCHTEVGRGMKELVTPEVEGLVGRLIEVAVGSTSLAAGEAEGYEAYRKSDTEIGRRAGIATLMAHPRLVRSDPAIVVAE